jgi:hypothetical protein
MGEVLVLKLVEKNEYPDQPDSLAIDFVDPVPAPKAGNGHINEEQGLQQIRKVEKDDFVPCHEEERLPNST